MSNSLPGHLLLSKSDSLPDSTSTLDSVPVFLVPPHPRLLSALRRSLFELPLLIEGRDLLLPLTAVLLTPAALVLTLLLELPLLVTLELPLPPWPELCGGTLSLQWEGSSSRGRLIGRLSHQQRPKHGALSRRTLLETNGSTTGLSNGPHHVLLLLALLASLCF